jgi:hypothetical protein
MTAVARKPKAGHHPATYSNAVLDAMADVLDRVAPSSATYWRPRIFDPFAGTGRKVAEHRIFGMGEWHGLELEPAFIETCWVEPGNACDPPFADGQFDVLATSPVYYNRMLDHHAPKDDSKRYSYTFSLRDAMGVPRSDASVQLSPANAGRMSRRAEYEALHLLAWPAVVAKLRPGALVMLNMSDNEHTVVRRTYEPQPYRRARSIEAVTVKGKPMVKVHEVVENVRWHANVLHDAGVEWLEELTVETPRMRNGQNAEVRADAERLLVGVRR